MRPRALLGVLVLLSLCGCHPDEVSVDFANGVNVYNFVSKENPVQIIAFENGFPSTLYNLLIDGTAGATYRNTSRGSVPLRRGESGQILALTYHWSERHDIKFNFESTQYTMPLSERQLRRIFGSPIKIERTKQPS